MNKHASSSTLKSLKSHSEKNHTKSVSKITSPQYDNVGKHLKLSTPEPERNAVDLQFIPNSLNE